MFNKFEEEAEQKKHLKDLHNEIDETLQDLIAYAMYLSEETHDVKYDEICDMLGKVAKTLDEIKL